MKPREKTFKLVGGVLIVGVLIALGLSYFFKPRYLTYEESQAYVDQINAQYLNDNYGGKSAEETLKLFTAALKKSDVQLASRYFLIEDQAKYFSLLSKIKIEGRLETYIETVDTRKVEFSDKEEVRYILISPSGLGSVLVLVKAPNEMWKIRTL